ncbi:hypothetical protein [Nocardioides sp. SYSU DS0651]|uniref:hypothetical protein n=1 Tax=Nocardioides sp. SYSU DS0651 TaxID=3415955 RepID=UPI003F4C5C92
MPTSSSRRGSTALLAGTGVVVLAVAAAVTAAVLRSTAPSGEGGSGPATAAVVAPGAQAVPVTRAVGSLAVLRDWDRARARAWAAGDPDALRRLYVPGSAAGERDVAMLRAWRERGLRVERLTMQVLAVELRSRTARRLVLVVTDRVADALAVATRGRAARRLPRDAPTTRRLEFHRVGPRWLLASAQEVGRAAESPADSTASTSGSANP